jgi:Tfp pilus assembly protein PilF
MKRLSRRLGIPGFARAIPAVLIGLSTLVVFLPSLNNGFVNWDDDRNLVDNQDFRGFSLSHLRWMWTNHFMEHYVPLTWMSYGLDYDLWGRAASGYHLTNVLLHSLNAVVFYFLALAFLRRSFAAEAPHPAGRLECGAALAALFFSLHPLRVESVAWVTERRDVLSGLFYLLALAAYLRGHRQECNQPVQKKYYFACLAFFVLSILSKEITLTLPVVLLILDIYPLQRLGGTRGWWKPPVQRVWLEKIPFVAISLADAAMTLYVAMRHHLVEPVAVLGWGARIAITVYGMAFYLMKTVVPLHLSPLYPLTLHKTELAAAPFAISLAIVLSVTAACIILRRRFPGLLAAWAAYSITLVPVGGIFHNGLQIAADRYTYLACLGWALLAGAGLVWCWRALSRAPARRVSILSAGLLVLLALSWLTRGQIRVWRDSDTLWTQAISVEPSFVAHSSLGASFFNEGDVLGALEQYRLAVALKPNDAIGHSHLGGALLDLQRWNEAAGEFRLAQKLDPRLLTAYNGLGHSLAMQGDLDGAIGQFQAALKIDPGYANARENLQKVLAYKQAGASGKQGFRN